MRDGGGEHVIRDEGGGSVMLRLAHSIFCFAIDRVQPAVHVAQLLFADEQCFNTCLYWPAIYSLFTVIDFQSEVCISLSLLTIIDSAGKHGSKPN